MKYGRVETHSAIPTAVINARRVDVWLPEKYDAQPGRRFPVVYMHDGQNLFYEALSYIGVTWGVDEALHALSQEDEALAAIVVGIWNTKERMGEYMPQKPLERHPETRAVFIEEEGQLKSDAYLHFLVHDVKGLIDRLYRTEPSRCSTWVVGSSMGGLISLYAVSAYPDVFAGAGCLSTAWPVADGVVVTELSRLLPPSGRHRFYFDLGSEGLDATYPSFQARVDSHMQAAGYRQDVDWMTRTFPGDEHSERAWRRRLHIPLRFLLAP